MLARVEIKIDCDEKLSVQMGALFHGALMEEISEDYASFLHRPELHPFAQHLERRDGEWYWIVNCMNREAAECIIDRALEPMDCIELKKLGYKVVLKEKKRSSISQRELMDQFYCSRASRYVKLHFVTPTAFKQNGKYLFYPDLRCIYQSLMNKYDASVSKESMVDEDTLEDLTANTEVLQYDLKSVKYQMGAVRIPSFIGKIKLRIKGTQTMADFGNLLFHFGTYSGVGIKSALGMGAFKMIDEGSDRGERKTVKTDCWQPSA